MGLIPGLGRSLRGVHGNPLHYSCLRIPWIEEPGGLQSMGSQRVRNDWSNWAQYLSLQIKCQLGFLHFSIVWLPYWAQGFLWLSGKESACNAGDTVPSLVQEDSLEKKTAIHSSILVWEIPWTEETGGLYSMGSQKSWPRLSDWTNIEPILYL